MQLKGLAASGHAAVKPQLGSRHSAALQPVHAGRRRRHAAAAAARRLDVQAVSVCVACSRGPGPATAPPVQAHAILGRCPQVIPALAGDATDQTPPDLPSYLFKERIVYLVSRFDQEACAQGRKVHKPCAAAVAPHRTPPPPVRPAAGLSCLPPKPRCTALPPCRA